jgi:hypothetical protein
MSMQRQPAWRCLLQARVAACSFLVRPTTLEGATGVGARAHRVQRGLGGAACLDVGNQVSGRVESEAEGKALHVLCAAIGFKRCSASGWILGLFWANHAACSCSCQRHAGLGSCEHTIVIAQTHHTCTQRARTSLRGQNCGQGGGRRVRGMKATVSNGQSLAFFTCHHMQQDFRWPVLTAAERQPVTIPTTVAPV